MISTGVKGCTNRDSVGLSAKFCKAESVRIKLSSSTVKLFSATFSSSSNFSVRLPLPIFFLHCFESNGRNAPFGTERFQFFIDFGGLFLQAFMLGILPGHLLFHLFSSDFDTSTADKLPAENKIIPATKARILPAVFSFIIFLD